MRGWGARAVKLYGWGEEIARRIVGEELITQTAPHGSSTAVGSQSPYFLELEILILQNEHLLREDNALRAWHT
jgi:hypothetical protein